MANFEFFFLLFLTLPFLFLPLIFKGTILELSFRKGNVYSLIFYKTLVFVIPAYLIVQYYGASAFPAIFLIATDEITFSVGLWIIYALYVFFIFLSFSLRILIPAKSVYLNPKDHIFDYKERTFAFSILVTGMSVFLIGSLFLGHKHAFIYSLLTGENLIRVRLDNSYFSSLPSQLSYIFSLSSWVLAIYSGRSSLRRSWFWVFFYFASAMFFGSIAGDKAPLIEVFFLFFLGRFTVSPVLMSTPGLIFYAACGVSFSLFLLFFVVSVQISELTFDQYLVYLAERAGVGQMAGTYESFAVGGLDGDFFWHIIPFASLFIDYPIYDKELMVFVENVEHTNMGVKNSLFISEAFGMGGYTLLIFSPIIVAISYSIALLVFYKWLSFLYGRNNSIIYFIPIGLLSMNITGGFSSFPFLKGCILNIILLAFFLPCYLIINLILKSNMKKRKTSPDAIYAQ